LGLQPWQPGEIAGLVFSVFLTYATFSATKVDKFLAKGNLESMKEKGVKVKSQTKVGSGDVYVLEDEE
jgi:hypothetical protein